MTASFPRAGIRSALEGDAPDRVAVWTSIACAIHCALTPLVLPLLPYAIGGIVGEGTEHAFRGLAFVLGVLSLGHSYRVVHRRWLPLGVFVCGMGLLFLASLQPPAHAVREILFVVVGASTIVTAHVVNLRFRRDVRGRGTCACACHEE